MTINGTRFAIIPAEPFAVIAVVVEPAADAVPEIMPLEKENPDGSPEMIMSTGNEGLGIYGCLYELKPGKMKFKVTENPKKEKKKLFKW